MAIVGGAPASLTLIQGIEEKLKCQAIAGYGLTETCPVITLGLPSDHMKILGSDSTIECPSEDWTGNDCYRHPSGQFRRSRSSPER